MALKQSFYGNIYDDSVPAFIPDKSGKFVFDRINHKMLSKTDFDKQIADAKYTMEAHEMGPAPDWWIKANGVDELEFTPPAVVPPVGDGGGTVQTQQPAQGGAGTTAPATDAGGTAPAPAAAPAPDPAPETKTTTKK